MEAWLMGSSVMEIFEIKHSQTGNILHCSSVDMCYSRLDGSVHFILLYEEAEEVLNTTGVELDGQCSCREGLFNGVMVAEEVVCRAECLEENSGAVIVPFKEVHV